MALIEVSERLGWSDQAQSRKEAKKELNLPLTEFFEPLITTVFLPCGNLFIQVYHRFKRKQFSFIYSYINNEMLSEIEVH